MLIPNWSTRFDYTCIANSMFHEAKYICTFLVPVFKRSDTFHKTLIISVVW